MNKPYTSPDMITYGDLTQITGVFGINGADDSWIDSTGEETDAPAGSHPDPAGSIDGCAAEGGTCLE